MRRARGFRAAMAILMVTALLVPGPAASAQVSPASITAPGSFVPLHPTRVLDSRTGQGYAGLLRDRVVLRLPLDPAVPKGASAVVLNVTVTEPTSAGWLSVFPWSPGASIPNASNLNFERGLTVANLVAVRIGQDNSVAFGGMTGAGTHVIADVAGYYIGGTPVAHGAYQPVSPARLFDTREQGGAFAPNEVRSYRVSGFGGIPRQGVAAVFINVTAVTPTGPGYLTAFPAGGDKPLSSNLNFLAGQVVPNLVMVKVDAEGRFSIGTGNGGHVHVVGDVQGYVLSSSTPTAVGGFVPLPPRRLFDTRTATYGPALAAGETFLVKFNRGVIGIITNTTVTEPEGQGYITLYPAQEQVPTVSNLNFTAGRTVPNLGAVKSDASYSVRWINRSTGRTHLLSDLAGVYVEPKLMSFMMASGDFDPVAWAGRG